MYIIGVTGGIACGKSTVSNEIKKYGGKVINADNMAHWQMEPGGEIYRAYVRHFGEGILNEMGQIDRRKVGDIVFNDNIELRWVNNITHPILLKYVRERLIDYQSKGEALVVLDVPLLFEAGWDRECDEVWVVHLKYNRQVKRLMERNNLTLSEAEARINAQISGKERRRRADEIIDNNGYKRITRRQIRRLILNRFPHLSANYERYNENKNRLYYNYNFIDFVDDV